MDWAETPSAALAVARAPLFSKWETVFATSCAMVMAVWAACQMAKPFSIADITLNAVECSLNIDLMPPIACIAACWRATPDRLA